MQPDATSFPFIYIGLHTGIRFTMYKSVGLNGENTGLKIADGLYKATVINITWSM